MKFFLSFITIIFLLFCDDLLASKKVAVVKLIKGEVNLVKKEQLTRLKLDDWVDEGAVIRTSDKSFVKLVFTDKSQMNVGPNSEMRIEVFNGKDSGVIDLVKGKIRSQVSKDYLQIENKDQSKIFVKTKNAVLGVRGTDFLIVTNGRTSSVILFEGEVLFAKLDKSQSVSSNLENIVNSGVRLFPGEFSVVEAKREPTVPSLLNFKQREILEKNENFESERSPSNSEEKVIKRSTTPDGLSGDVVSIDSNSKLEEMKIEEKPRNKEDTKEKVDSEKSKDKSRENIRENEVVQNQDSTDVKEDKIKDKDKPEKTKDPKDLESKKMSNNSKIQSDTNNIQQSESPKSTDKMEDKGLEIVENQRPRNRQEVKNLQASQKPEGFVEGDKIKPANGSFVHLDSGVVIPPDKTAVLDKNTNSYLDVNSDVKVSSNGDFIPPKDVTITKEGKILILEEKVGGKRPKEIPNLPPVLGNDLSSERDKVIRPQSLDTRPSREISSTPNSDETLNMNNQIRIQNQIEKIKETTRTTIRVRNGSE